MELVSDKWINGVKLTYILVAVCSICSLGKTYCQDHINGYGFNVGLLVTNQKFPNGKGATFSNGLIINDHSKFNFQIQFFKQFKINKKITLDGVSTFWKYSSVSKYKYPNPEPFMIVESEPSITYFALGPRFRYYFDWGKISLSPFVGLNANVKLKSTLRTVSSFNGVDTSTITTNNESSNFNFNYDLGISVSYKLAKTHLSLTPSYTRFLKENKDNTLPPYKSFYGYGLTFGFVF